MTNREWINTMTNEQLIKLMRTFKENTCDMCAKRDDDSCGYCHENEVKWLQQDYEEKRWEEKEFEYLFW